MVLKNITLLVAFLALFSFTHDARLEKKIQKVLVKNFENKVFIKHELRVDQKAENENWFGITEKASKKNLGLISVNSAIGRFDKFDFMIVFNPNKSIKTVRVLIYREDHGGEIGSKRWLKQFEGKSPKDAENLAQSIDGISGATMSCDAITKEIQKSLITIRNISK